MYKDNNTKNEILTNGINSFKMDMKYIQHRYDLQIGVGMKFQIHGRRRKQ